jgi:hypothetical protein
MSKKIVVECDPDEMLAKALGLGRKEIVHQNNKGEVCNYMSKMQIPLGIIDEDPGSGQPKFLKQFQIVEERFNVRKLYKANTNQTILVIKPRLEEWITGQCAQSRVNLGDFHLPGNPKRLKEDINLKLDRFRALLNELLRRNNPGLQYLLQIIEENKQV